MANLLIEIGNTALKAAWAEGTTLGKTFRYQGEKFLKYILGIVEREKPEVMTIASSIEIPSEVREVLSGQCGRLVVFDRKNTDTLAYYGFPEYLSYDRAACLVAVSNLFKGKASTLFDFGTTIAVDWLDEEGKYAGGIVSPGCRMRFNALNRYSRNLPLLNNPSEDDAENNTLESSIRKGVISGMMFEIEGYVSEKPENIIIFTGGDAFYFAKKMKNSIFVVSNLGLQGLALMTEDYVKNNKE